MLFDRRYASIRNFDSTISIDVIRMKSYLDNLFDPTCVPVRVTIDKTLFSLTLNLRLHLKTNSQLPPWNTPAGNLGSRMQNDTLYVWSLSVLYMKYLDEKTLKMYRLPWRTNFW